MASIVVDGTSYKVLERLPTFTEGMQAKMVQVDQGCRVAVRYYGGPWNWYRPIVTLRGPITGQSIPDKGTTDA